MVERRLHPLTADLSGVMAAVHERAGAQHLAAMPRKRAGLVLAKALCNVACWLHALPEARLRLIRARSA